jgi:hypothetical protein
MAFGINSATNNGVTTSFVVFLCIVQVRLEETHTSVEMSSMIQDTDKNLNNHCF